eukprot:gnl/Dysnectes_brevis/606_a670_7344.p1 GENE.gnl/Dysnectes_brevis/606_a670_7344~~gnl/Dysnectes_brevis/606_a670_7344.p1  ORF type:complete len:148 (+),score=18.54 gnl/Dysnectes_brevis/606_a670_7344:79-522(+)
MTSEHNIARWHWEEKSFLPFTKARLAELLKFDHNTGDVEVKYTLKSVKGNAIAFFRKGKIKTTWDLEISVSAQVEFAPGSDPCAANVVLEILADEDPDDWEITVKPVKKDCPTTIRRALKKVVSIDHFAPRIMVWAKELNDLAQKAE